MHKDSRTPSEIKKELTIVNGLIQEQLELSSLYPELPSVRLSVEQLKHRRDELIRELRGSLEENYKITYLVKFEGESTEEGEIPISTLSKALNSLQELITAVANRNKKGEEEAARGKIPDKVIAQTKMNVAAMAAGSFSVVLAMDRGTLFHPGDESALPGKVVGKIKDMFDDEQNTEKISEFKKEMGPRAFNKYKQLVESLRNSKVSLSFFDEMDGEKGLELDWKKAVTLSSNIEKVSKMPDEEITLIGRIDIIDYSKGSFVLHAEDRDVKCTKCMFPHDEIRSMNGLNEYSIDFTIKRTYYSARDVEKMEYVAKSYKMIERGQPHSQ